MLQASYLEYVDNSESTPSLDEEGYLIDPLDWSRSFTERRAREAGIELKGQTLALRSRLSATKYLRLGALPPMRSVCKAVGFDKQELKQQFGNCLTLWKIAGLPNPGEEAKAYMS